MGGSKANSWPCTLSAHMGQFRLQRFVTSMKAYARSAVVPAFEALGVAALVGPAGVEVALAAVAFLGGGDEALGRAALRAVLDEVDFAFALDAAAKARGFGRRCRTSCSQFSRAPREIERRGQSDVSDRSDGSD